MVDINHFHLSLSSLLPPPRPQPDHPRVMKFARSGCIAVNHVANLPTAALIDTLYVRAGSACSPLHSLPAFFENVFFLFVHFLLDFSHLIRHRSLMIQGPVIVQYD